jgi:hypothetical protein
MTSDEELQATVALLEKAGEEPLPEGFALELHKKLVEAGPPPVGLVEKIRRAIAARPLATMLSTAAAAAGLAVLITRALPQPGAPKPPAAAVAARVPSSKIALVKIDFVAEKDADDVQFEIMLPDGLRFFSRGQELAERTFRWKGKLTAGSNPMPIAVKGPKPGRYRVIAHAVGDGVEVTHEVILEVVS